MTKTKGWFVWVKRLFISQSETSRKKLSRQWRWIFGRLERYPSQAVLTASDRALSEATEEQKRHALTVAIAAAVAAEAALASAHAAAEVVRLTAASPSFDHIRKFERNLAATKIQSAYRAHLARKALRALQGVVKLQAIVRGRAVRRQTIISLKELASIKRRQAEVWKISIYSADERRNESEKKHIGSSKGELDRKEITLECSSERRWDGSVISKEDTEAIWIRKQEAAIKRERMKKYSFSLRENRNVKMPGDSVGRTDEKFERSQVKERHLRNEESVNAQLTPIHFPRDRPLCAKNQTEIC